MEQLLGKLIELGTEAGSKILLALVVFLIGKIVIGRVLKLVERGRLVSRMDPTVHSFMNNFVKIGLYVILVVSIIGILGVPMASIVTVLASAGVAVGMALQGALGNLAGGIMVLIFRPFQIGDYVAVAGAEGTVKEIALFYTTLDTPDNRRITVPNGNLMNANVENFTVVGNRRMDLIFTCARGEDVDRVQDLMLDVMNRNPMVFKDPAPFASLSGGTKDSMEFTARVYMKTEDYWDVNYALLQDITKAMGAAGVEAPAVRVVTENR